MKPKLINEELRRRLRMVDLRMKESSRNLYVIFSMDCERIANESPEGEGPRSWEIGGEAISRFSEILSNEGFRAVFFIQPETAERYAGLFLKLKDKGFELGLHIHPGNFRDHSFKKYLGSYSPDEQHHILSLAISDWRKALGFEPKSFRAGFFSTNDYTYKILYELGFRQSSTSKPNRTFRRSMLPGLEHIRMDITLIQIIGLYLEH